MLFNKFATHELITTNKKNPDPSLINPWGITQDNDYIWIANNATGTITNYNLFGKKLSNIINVPSTNNNKSSPTDIVINYSNGFLITQNSLSVPSYMIIATENGTICGYNPQIDPINAITIINNSSTNAVYTGLILVKNYLYATDFHNKKIDVFDSNFSLNSNFQFIDTSIINQIPADFAPYNIEQIQNKLYVSYAQQLSPANISVKNGKGNGYINIFDLNGEFLSRFASKGNLSSPWAMIIAPITLGCFVNYLLVGNFGNGQINIYDFNGNYLTKLKNKYNDPLLIFGLHALIVVRVSQLVYFSTGTDTEMDGIIGDIIEECN